MTVMQQENRTLETVSRLLKMPIAIFENISIGRNSEVYRVELNDGSRYAVKRYKGATLDGRSRLDVEFKALSFLRENGIHSVPEPVAFEEDDQVAIYGYVEGTRIGGSEVTPSDVDRLVEFIGALKNKRSAKGAESLCDAAEACFSLGEIVRNVESRRRKLLDSQTTGNDRSAIIDFLNGPFWAALDEISVWSGERLRSGGGDPDVELARSMRTLSPSDFGFHNALRLENGDIMFLDFEYFGWDDPAKLISDFLLSPAMSLGDSLKRKFVAGAIETFGEDVSLPARLDAYYPLFGLKWALIMLNEFLPEYSSIREYDESGGNSLEDTKRRQLEKAEGMLSGIISVYKNFPFKLQRKSANDKA